MGLYAHIAVGYIRYSQESAYSLMGIKREAARGPQMEWVGPFHLQSKEALHKHIFAGRAALRFYMGGSVCEDDGLGEN